MAFGVISIRQKSHFWPTQTGQTPSPTSKHPNQRAGERIKLRRSLPLWPGNNIFQQGAGIGQRAPSCEPISMDVPSHGHFKKGSPKIQTATHHAINDPASWASDHLIKPSAASMKNHGQQPIGGHDSNPSILHRARSFIEHAIREQPNPKIM
ncbi:hypothetical protein ACLOJK_006798, partial [Asimina triloba]